MMILLFFFDNNNHKKINKTKRLEQKIVKQLSKLSSINLLLLKKSEENYIVTKDWMPPRQ